MGKCMPVDMMLGCSHSNASVASKLLQSRKEDQKVFCNLIDKSSRHQVMHSLTVKLVFQPAEGNGGRRLDDASVSFVLHVDPALPVGVLLSSPGPFAATLVRFFATVTGKAGTLLPT